MFDWLSSLADTTGFVPRKECGAWTPDWIAVHAGSDLLIWLAYLSIPLVLVAVARHPAVRPLRPIMWLFSAFILACGTTHLIEAILFEHPVYRLSGVVKLITAAVSWATVFALVPAAPRLIALLDRLPGDAPRPSADPDAGKPEGLVYSLAILVALLAVLIRFALDPLLGDLHPFSVCLLAVIFVGWYGGFGPGVVTMLVSGVAALYLFVPPRRSLSADGLGHQLGVGIFLFTGLGVVVLGELQRTTRRRLHGKMLQLWGATDALATEKRKADETLGRLDAFLRHAPGGIAMLDADLRFVWVNETFAAANGEPIDGHIGRPLRDVLPDVSDNLAAEYREVIDSGQPLVNRLVYGRTLIWQMNAFRVPLGDGRLGLGIIGVDVTELRMNEERVRESEEKFRAMADGIPQLAWMTRPDGHIFWYNQRWYDYTGTTPEEMDGWGWEKVHDPAELPRVTAAWKAALAAGEPFEETFPLRRHDGQFWWHLTRAIPLKDADGRVLLWFGTNTDITAQREMEQALRESEGRFRQLADAMPQMVFTADATGRVDYFNRRWYEYTGFPDDGAPGDAGWQGVDEPTERAAVAARWQHSVRTGEPFEAERRLRRADGQFRWHLGRAVSVRDAAGQIVRWYGTNTDIHDHKRAEQALRESEGRFRTLTESMPQIVWMTRPDGYHEYFNARWYEYTGLTPEESLGWGWSGPLHPDDVERSKARWKRSTDTGTEYEIEYRFRRHDGAYQWFLGRALPVRDDTGEVVRWLGTCTGIDEQVRTAQELAESRRFVESVLHSLPAHLAVIDADGGIVSVNESWRQFGEANGVPPGYDWTTANYFEASRKDEYGERAVAGIRAVARGEREAFEMEYPCHGNGRERYFTLRANRFRGGDPVRLVVTHENVTDRVRAEREVRNVASQLRQLTEGMPLLMWACRPTGECDYLSRQWVEYTGERMEDQLGKQWLRSVHPEDRPRTNAAWQAAIDGMTDYDVEYRLRRHDGEYRWFAVRGIPLRDQSGRIVRWYGSCTDIHYRTQQAATLERLVAERTAELREQRIFVDAILDNVTEGIVACDADGRLKLFNAATRRMHGLPAEPLPPDRWPEFYSLYEADGVTPMPADRVPLLRAWRGEAVADAEMVIRTAGQPDRYVLCSGEQLRAADGTRFGAVVSMRDMTHRREYERQLLHTSAALQDSNEDLEKFAYIASHDLQEPLRKIQAFGTRLADKFRPAVGDQGKDYIDRMLDSAGRMRQLINDLLAFSRVSTKAAPFVPVNLDLVVRDVLSDLEDQIVRSGGRVEVGDLPTVEGDFSQLRQAFQNLVGNALKFAKPGVPPVVSVAAVPFSQLPPNVDSPPPSGVGWRVTVSDSGIGFEQGYADRIFELFQRLHSRTQYEGTGLGLAIVRKIILRHGAAITARGRPGEGAEFVIDWPTRTASPQ